MELREISEAVGRRREAEVYGRLLPLYLEADLEFLSLAGLTVEKRAGEGGGESREKLGASRVFAGRAAARRPRGRAARSLRHFRLVDFLYIFLLVNPNLGPFYQTDTIIKPPQMCIQPTSGIC